MPHKLQKIQYSTEYLILKVPVITSYAFFSPSFTYTFIFLDILSTLLIGQQLTIAFFRSFFLIQEPKYSVVDSNTIPIYPCQIRSKDT
jgi:hypothetical protein